MGIRSVLSKHAWTVDNLAYSLKTGVMPSGDALAETPGVRQWERGDGKRAGTLGEVVFQGRRFMSDKGRYAIAVYLLDDHTSV